jgi:CheY-like chemotaxis protein
MRILIIEDQEHKLGRLKALLEMSLANISVEVARSYHSGLAVLEAGGVSFCVLDMSLPVYEPVADSRKSSVWVYGGLEVLRQLRRKKISVPVLVVTQFDYFDDETESMTLRALKERLDSLGDTNYLGTVLYSSTKPEWEADLTSSVFDALKKL